MFFKSLKSLLKPKSFAFSSLIKKNPIGNLVHKKREINSLLKIPSFEYHYDLAKAKYLYGHPFKPKGALRNRKEKKGINGVGKKRKNYKKPSKYKLKNHKGLIKRIKIVGPASNRSFEFKSPGLVKKMSKKRKQNLKNQKRRRFISKADLRQVKKMLPYYKRRKYKNIINLSY